MTVSKLIHNNSHNLPDMFVTLDTVYKPLLVLYMGQFIPQQRSLNSGCCGMANEIQLPQLLNLFIPSMVSIGINLCVKVHQVQLM